MDTSLREILTVVWKRRKLFVLVIILCSPIFLITSGRGMKRVYKAVASVKLAKVSYIPVIMRSLGIDYKEVTPDINYEANNIKSDRVLKRALKILGMEETIQNIKRLENSISVESVNPKDMVIQIAAVSTSPKSATKFVNAVAESFVEYSKLSLYSDVEETLKTLDNLSENLEGLLDKAYTEFADFARESGVINPQEQFKMELNSLKDLNKKLIDVEERLSLLSAMSSVATEPSSMVDLATVLPNIAPLSDEYLNLILKKNNLLQIYTPSNPEIINIDRQISIIQDKIKSALIFEIKVLERQKEQLEAEIGSIYSNLVRFPDIYVNYAKNERKINLLGDLFLEHYLALLNMKLVGSVRVSIASIFKRAHYAEEISKRGRGFLTLLSFGIILGLIAGFVSVLIAESLETRFSDIDTLEKDSGLPVIGILPYSPSLSDPLFVVSSPKSRISESIRTLRVNLSLAALKDKFFLALTSSLPKEGKTTISANLAMSFAQAGKDTTIVDLNIRDPCVHRLFGLENSWGFVDAVLGNLEAEEVIKYAEEGAPLKIITAGPKHPSPPDLFSSREAKDFILKLKDISEVIVLDFPPLVVADIIPLAEIIDMILIVINIGKTPKYQLIRTKDILTRAKAKIYGTVLNFVTPELVPTIGSYYYKYKYPDEEKEKKKRKQDRR